MIYAIKIVLSSVFSLVALAAAIGSLFPKLSKRVERTGTHVFLRASPTGKRIIVGFCAFLLFTYFMTDVVSQLQESRKQSVVYQNHLVLKTHVNTLAKRLNAHADEIEKNPAHNADVDRLIRVMEMEERLAVEGVDTRRLKDLWESENQKDAESWRQIAAEFEKLASELPK